MDTSAQTLPNNVTERRVIPIYKFDRESGDVTPTVQEKSNLYLRDLLGTLPGSRITVSSITEDQLSFAAAEGLNSLIQNLAERTFDQAGSYLVKGFDTFIGGTDDDSIEAITNAGAAPNGASSAASELSRTPRPPSESGRVATIFAMGQPKNQAAAEMFTPTGCASFIDSQIRTA